METEKKEHKKEKKENHEEKKEHKKEKEKEEENDVPKIPKFIFKKKSNVQLPKEIDLSKEVPISVSKEFDGYYSKAAKSKVDRSYWETEVLRLHPDLNDIVNRVDSVSRAAQLANLFLPSRRLLPHDGVLALICQHLRTIGLLYTEEEIKENIMFNIDYPLHKPNSQLIHHLERGIVSSDGFYNLLFQPPATNEKEEGELKKQIISQISTTFGVTGVKKQDDKSIKDDDDLNSFDFNNETKMPDKGTTNQLVWAAVTRSYNDPKTNVHQKLDDSIINIMAMTYHTFLNSHTMLRKLQEAYERLPLKWEEDAKKPENSGKDMTIIRDREELMFVSLVEKWIETSSYDFDMMLIQNLNKWILNTKFQNKGSQKRLLSAFTKFLKGTEKSNNKDFSTEGVVLPKNMFTGEFSLTDMDMTELAKQIIMYAGRFYYKTTAKEFLDCAWSKPRLRHRAPNVCALTDHFNKLNQYVQHEILFASSVKRRVELWNFFAKLAFKLWKMRDFFDGMAIATAFNANPIYRLKLHKQYIQSIDPSAMSGVDSIMHDARSEKNFKALLEKHNEAYDDGKQEVIPYIGVYLTHLTFFYDGNKDFIDDKVNFSKCAVIHNFIKKILSFQKLEFNYPCIDQVQNKFNKLRLWESSQLVQRSMEIEPKDMTFDAFKEQINE